jgi:MoaA/NifB/PqqE/SkfB family radical SAM enzyme
MSDIYDESDEKQYDMAIYWSVTGYCNFSCPGCVDNSKKIDSINIPERINIPGLKKFLEKLGKTVKIIFTGGEPLLVDNIIEAFIEISKNNFIGVVSNFTSPKIKEFAEKINPERVIVIKASAHLMQLEKYNLLDTFITNYNLLKNKGFNIFTQEIAYPVMADKVEKYKKKFMDNGIELDFQAYRGLWNGKRYPESYTDEEYKIFNFKKFYDGSKDKHYGKNRLCNAGYNVVIVRNNNNIYPCYGIRKKIGNIYKSIKLNNKLIKCPVDYCDCPLLEIDSLLFKKALAETRIQ